MRQNTIAGALLRMERIRQDKGQKEICYGICVPSYMSKIEHGSVCPDDKIIAALFERLGIVYEENEQALTEWETKTEDYFYRLQYCLDTETVYKELAENDTVLSYSRLAVDWLLIKGFEEGGTPELLETLKEYMRPKQLAYYRILQSWERQSFPESVEYCNEALRILGNSFAITQLCEAYMMQGDYTAIHRMENKLVATAVEEGNTYRLADYFFLNGTAYACLNLEEMMLLYYERSMRLLQNTEWKKASADLYYNMGATYISLKKYDLSLKYLDMAEASGVSNLPDSMALDHKKAVALIRSGNKEQAGIYLEKMRVRIAQSEDKNEADILKYEEACWECKENFMDDPAYLELLEKLIKALKRERHFGHLYFYRDIITQAYTRQRKYKKALEFEREISSRIQG